MRLINARTLQLEEFQSEIPDYSILSHTWGNDEVTFQDWNDLERARKKLAFSKIEGSCRQSLRDGIGYVWVDTNCIDKTSSSELSEAINSMFAWYRDSSICYVYLADVRVQGYEESETSSAKQKFNHEFRHSRWFTRGWTLQELIAPLNVVFYSRDWDELGTKKTLRTLISDITNIDGDYLRQPKKIQYASIARRMSWMSRRTTTRIEDVAYCMLGIFNINMSLLYGEGSKAFLRLQEEIIKVSNDQTIFCWQSESNKRTLVPSDWISILAPHPAFFEDSGQFFPSPSSNTSTITPYAITNYGLRITAPLFYTCKGVCVVLDVYFRTGRRDQSSRVIVQLHRSPSEGYRYYVRLLTSLLVTTVPPELMEDRTELFVDCRNSRSRGIEGLIFAKISSPQIPLKSCGRNILVLAFAPAMEVDEIPLSALGINFHYLDSAVELSNDISGECKGILLRAYSPTEFLVLIAASKESKRGVHWYVEILPTSGQDVARPIHLDKILRTVKERDLFGTWRSTWPLKSVVSWQTANEGAVVCCLNLDKIESVQENNMSVDSSNSMYLSRSTDSEGILVGLTSKESP